MIRFENHFVEKSECHKERLVQAVFMGLVSLLLICCFD